MLINSSLNAASLEVRMFSSLLYPCDCDHVSWNADARVVPNSQLRLCLHSFTRIPCFHICQSSGWETDPIRMFYNWKRTVCTQGLLLQFVCHLLCPKWSTVDQMQSRKPVLTLHIPTYLSSCSIGSNSAMISFICFKSFPMESLVLGCVLLLWWASVEEMDGLHNDLSFTSVDERNCRRTKQKDMVGMWLSWMIIFFREVTMKRLGRWITDPDYEILICLQCHEMLCHLGIPGYPRWKTIHQKTASIKVLVWA